MIQILAPGQPQANLAVVKEVNNLTPNVGQLVTFTITASNLGPDAATGVVVTDNLPAGYTLVSATPSVGSWSAPTWTIGNLANGASATLTIVASVNATGPYANTASITGNENDPVPGNNTSTVTPVPVPVADLAVGKTVNNPTPNIGQQVTFTITATNNGPSPATGVFVTDNLPAGYTLVSATPTVGSWSAPTWTIGNLASGASATLTIVATVNDTGSYVNTAAITGNQNDPNLANNTSSASVAPVGVQQADLAVVKTVNNATPIVGQNVTFTIVVTNNGPDNATGITITDQLPAGLTYVSHLQTQGTYNPATGVWGTLSLANGISATLQITATVTSGALPNATNTAAVTASSLPDPDPDNNSSSVTVTPTTPLQADLAIVKSVNNLNPAAGQNVVFTLTVTNNGPSAATGVQVTDQLPSGYTYVSHTGPGTYNAGTGIWTIGNLANGASAVLQITATVNPTGNYVNTATVSGNEPDPNPANNSSNATVTPVALLQADLAVSKSVNNDMPTVGQNVTFTIVVTNNGPDAATSFSITDQLPAGLTYVSHSLTQGTYNPATGVWGTLTLANGASTTLTIVATVTDAALPNVTNIATITSSNVTDPNPDNNSSSVVVTPVTLQEADLAVVKTVNAATPNVGQNVTFTITVTNNGPNNATGVTVTDQLPAGLTYVSHNASQGAYIPATGIWSTLTIANGGSATLTIVATVTSGALPSATNIATVTASNQTDPVPGNNSGSATVTPVAAQQADLAVVKIVDNATPNVGQNVVFAITVTNNGPANATGVVITDQLPAGLTYLSSTTTQGTYNPATGLWQTLSIANGANATLTIIATVTAGALPSATNIATVTASNQSDPVPGNNTGSVTVTPSVVQQADLAITKAVNTPTPLVGQNVVFTITVTNNGPAAATGVQVTDQLPSGYTYLSHTTNTGTYTAATGIWAIGNLANGASTVLQITATVNATGNYVNTATVIGTQPDPTPGNNTGSVTTTPVPVTDLAVNKTVNNATPNVGSNVIFTITVTNNGPSAATGVQVIDQLPSGYTYVSHSGIGTYIVATGIWTIGNLANGATATLLITATVNVTGNYVNTATVSGAQTDPVPANNTNSATTTPVQLANLAIVKTVNNPTPNVGQNVVFTLTVTNSGPSAATGVQVTDQLPSGYTYVSHTGPGTYNAATGLWAIGNMANGATAILQITATVNMTGNYVNTATVSSNQQDPVPGNNTSSVATIPVLVADLAISKSVNDPGASVGDIVVFTLVANNKGPSEATGVAVSDLLPPGYTYFDDDGAGAYDPATGTWSIGHLPVCCPETLQITAIVTAINEYVNTAVISGDQFDPDPDNDTDSAYILPPVSIAISNITHTFCNAASGSAVLTSSDGSSITLNGITLPSGSTFTGLPAGYYVATTTGIPQGIAGFNIRNQDSDLAGMVTEHVDATCFGSNNGAVTVTALGGRPPYQYQLDLGVKRNTGSFTGLSAGEHSVLITDADGCRYTVSFDIDEPTLLDLSVTSHTNVSCFGGSDGAVTVLGSGGVTAYTYSIVSGPGTPVVNGNMISNMIHGEYIIQVTDANQCTARKTVVIGQPAAAITASVSVVDAACFAEASGSATVTPAGGTPPYLYLWNNGSTDQTATGLAAGTYAVNITDSKGCSFTVDEVVVGQPQTLLMARVVTTTHPRCPGEATGSAEVEATGGVPPYAYSWSNGQNTAAVSELTAGRYQVSVSDANGCVVTLQVDIIEPPVLMVFDIFVEDVICRDDSLGSVRYTVSGGQPPYTYLWNNGRTSRELYNMPAGDYQVLITDANGCSMEAEFVIDYRETECELRIPEGISMDGSGLNDIWRIAGLWRYPQNKVQVFNRWGTLVYEAAPYQNDWDGTPNRGRILTESDGRLPTGTYYYIIRLDANLKPESGYIYLTR